LFSTPPPPPLSPDELAIEAANSDLALPAAVEDEFEDFQFAVNVIDLRSFDLVGGVFHFDLVEMPPQPKEVRQWNIVELEDPPIRRMAYEKELPGHSKASLTTEQHHVMLDETDGTEANSKKSRPGARMSQATNGSQASHASHARAKERRPNKRTAKVQGEANKATHNDLTSDRMPAGKSRLSTNTQVTWADGASLPEDLKPPFGLSFGLPTDCVFYEAPIVGLWDEGEKVWKKSQFEEVSYDEETRTVSLSTYKFGPLGCFQDRHVNFPFTGWELRPLSNSSALLTINAALVTVQIEILGNKCCIREPSECRPLEKVLGEWVTPKTLIHILRSRGINVFPYEDSRKYVQNAFKKKWMEENKSQLWGLFLFPEEFDVPEEEPVAEPEDDFLSFLKKPAIEEPEPEPEPQPPKKRSKKRKNQTNNNIIIIESSTNLEEALSVAEIGLKSSTSINNINRNKKRGRSKASLTSGKKTRVTKRKKNQPKTKSPQQILWDNFNEWLTKYRVKHASVIQNLHREMALVAHVLAFSASKWNSEAGETRLIVRAAEAAPEETVAENGWENFLVCGKRVMPLKLRDEDEQYSEDLKNGALVMSNFYHMAKHIGSESLQRRIETVDFAFVETLREVLDATQLLVFS